MATRSSIQDKILQFLRECETTKEIRYSVADVAAEFEISDKAAFDALSALEDAGKAEGEGRGLTSEWWIKGEKKEEAPKPKRTRRTKAQMDAAREEERKRLEYATRVAEAREEGAQHRHPMEDTHPVVSSETSTEADKRRTEGVARIMEKVEAKKAQTPVIAENGEKITIPVDFDDPSKGRRELDASKGERLLGETMYVPRTPVVEAQTFSPEFSEPKNSECPENEIPALPEGVSPNVWELAHDANTPSARAYWMRQAQAQMDEYAETYLAEAHMAEILAATVNEDVPPF